MHKHIGFCCKWINDTSEFGGMNVKDKDLNSRSTTMRWLRDADKESKYKLKVSGLINGWTEAQK
tara:strand:+ start:637 stop:828 length:192 start_codon:yes stop_codon:yes gene_type:complete